MKNGISITVRATRRHTFHSRISISWPCPCLLVYTVRATPPKHRRLVTTSSTLASYKMAAPLPTRVYGSCYTSRTSSLQYLWLSHRIWWLCLCLLAGTLGDRLIQFMQHLQKHHCSQYLPLLHHIWRPCLLTITMHHLCILPSCCCYIPLVSIRKYF